MIINVHIQDLKLWDDYRTPANKGHIHIKIKEDRLNFQVLT